MIDKFIVDKSKICEFCVVTEYYSSSGLPGKIIKDVSYCYYLHDAIFISDLLIYHFSGRPFSVKVLYLGDDDLDLDSFCYNGERDLNDYFEGVYCYNV